jgi:hypothetical protein
MAANQLDTIGMQINNQISDPLITPNPFSIKASLNIAVCAESSLPPHYLIKGFL